MNINQRIGITLIVIGLVVSSIGLCSETFISNYYAGSWIGNNLPLLVNALSTWIFVCGAMIFFIGVFTLLEFKVVRVEE